MAGGDITEEEHEITLHAERPVVTAKTTDAGQPQFRFGSAHREALP